MFSKRGLLVLNGLLWSIAGYNVLRKGISALAEDYRWWIVLLAGVIGAGFLMMFRNVVRKYTLRIQTLDGEHFPFYRFMSTKGYLLIGLMILLGIGMRLIPNMPITFFASFYSGLGSGLTYGAIQFLINSIRFSEHIKH